ncbi:hypothetical protein [Tardiphaga sp. 841_E9_N1_2]|uniref:hypothetical protein n=1 Tax=Tardiphaga sp. 841_E9_N1_2 TaxID=3240762 RepID=UPI003F20DA4F
MANDKFIAKYEVADGYVGKSRPQSLVIRPEDIDVSPNMTDEQLEEALYEMVEEDMQQKISADVDNAAEFVAWARSLVEEA